MKHNTYIYNALVLFLLSVLLPSHAYAQYSNAIKINSQEKTVTLTGNTYTLANVNTTITSSNGAAIKVAENTSAILYLPKGSTLKVTGSNANDSRGFLACPGIEIPESSTLFITGEGTIIAQGGNGTKGSYGQNGSNGNYSSKCSGGWKDGGECRGGRGGDGGNGGYGAAPGIGTPGGKGPEGGKGVTPDHSTHHKSGPDAQRHGSDGGSGNNGEAGHAMGTLVVLGKVYITSYSGQAPKSDTSSNLAAKAGNSVLDHYCGCWHDDWRAAGGGGGGQGADGEVPPYSIGQGGASGGSGGAGGGGGTDNGQTTIYTRGGRGGYAGSNHSSTRYLKGNDASNDNENSGGNGGSGGRSGTYYSSHNGKIFRTLLASQGGQATMDPQCVTELDRIDHKEALRLLPGELKYKMTGATWASGNTEINFYNGAILSKIAPHVLVPKGQNDAIFHGYYDQFGNQVYDDKGNLHIVKHSEHFPYQTTYDSQTTLIACDMDINLMPLWEDIIKVYLTHIAEDPDFVAGEDPSHTPYSHVAEYSRHKDYAKFSIDEPEKKTFKAFTDFDGRQISESCIIDKEHFSVVEKSDTTITLQHKVENVTFHYKRKTYNLTYDLSSMSDPSSAWSRVENEELYTKAGQVKYGHKIVYPKFKQSKGRKVTSWTPGDLEKMPGKEIVLKPIETEVRFLANKHVDTDGRKGCEVKLSATSSIAYAQKVNIDIVLGDDHEDMLTSIKVTGNDDQKEISLTRISDLKYTFNMPDQDVTVTAKFGQRYYNLGASLSNIDGTMIAITDGHGKFYADDNEFFQFPDSSYAGKLKDFPHYSGQHFFITADYDGSTSGTMRPDIYLGELTGIHEPLDKVTLFYDGARIRKYVDVQIDKAKNDVIKVHWEVKTGKRVSFYNSGLQNDEDADYAEPNMIGWDDEPGLLSQNSDIEGLKSFGGDYLWFTVNTNDESFDSQNITASYQELDGTICYLKINNLGNLFHDNNCVYAFYMPERDVKIMLHTGKKRSVTHIISDVYKDKYEIRHVEEGVVGAPMPFFVIYNDEDNYDPCFKKPVAAYKKDGKWCYSEVEYHTVNRRGLEFIKYDIGVFTMPDADVTICEYGMLNDNDTQQNVVDGIDHASISKRKFRDGKYFIDGKFLIVRNGKCYTATGIKQ